MAILGIIHHMGNGIIETRFSSLISLVPYLLFLLEQI